MSKHGQAVIVIDTETTGFDPEKDRVVDIAGVMVSGARGKYRSEVILNQLIDPGIPIPPEAMGIHHILDREVKGKPKLSAVLARGLHPYIPFVPAAHNAKFDSSFVPLEEGFDEKEIDWICTWRCAQHLWPDAPGYSNQTLRYWLKLFKEPYLDATPVHRAKADAIVTAGILERMLETCSVDDLLDKTKRPITQRLIRFGMHRGVEWAAVPRSYLGWILGKPAGEFDPDVVHTARHYYDGGGR